MELIRKVVESFVRLAKSEINPSTVLVAADDIFEVTKTSSVILQGPTLSEDSARRTPAMLVHRNEGDHTFEQCRHPRLYHLDFDIIVTTGTQAELLEFMDKMARFYQLHPVLLVENSGELNLTELTPLGGLRRVNLSNLRQASGRCRIEDCPVYDGRITSGRLATGIKLDLNF